MKKLCLILSIIMAFAVFTVGCSSADNSDTNGGHKLYVRDKYLNESMQATFKSTADNSTKTVDMKLLSKGEDYNTFVVDGDEAYNRVVLTYGNDSTIELAYNSFVSGYHITANGVVPFVYDEPEEEIKYTTVALPFDEDGEKYLYIWTPADYNADDKDTKYSVIYMTDGQNLYNRTSTTYGSWNVAESAMSMMSLSDNRCIIVGIDNAYGNRDKELTPAIGKVAEGEEAFDNGRGKEFSDFVYNTAVPYVEENYNVYTDAEHNSVCGSSSGGIESFYIGMEHPDKFGTIGALSPAFLLFDKSVWSEYLSGLKFESLENKPFVYIYNGDNDDLESTLLTSAKDMKDWLIDAGYPEDKIAVEIYDKGLHNERYWRAVFPEFLKYAFK